MDENNVKARSKKKKTLVIVVVLVLFATVGALGAVCMHLYQKSNAGQHLRMQRYPVRQLWFLTTSVMWPVK